MAQEPLTASTPLADALVLTGFRGTEAISRPYRFEVDFSADDPVAVAFDRLLGAEITVHLALPGGRVRHFSGICAGVAQGARRFDRAQFTAEVVPSLWRLTRRVQSRIFQHLSVPEILARVLADVPNVAFDLDGTFHERDFCVQYQESDFAFASRLMEEEGIYYYFLHRADRHETVIANRLTFPPLAPVRLVFHESAAEVLDEQRITRWEKRQELRSGRLTLRDHTFEIPHDPLEAAARIQESVAVGKVMHRLSVAGNDRLELYQWPGEYARRFDGVDRNGNPQGDRELGKIEPDARRTARIAMEREAVEAIAIKGRSFYRHLTSGHAFILQEQAVGTHPGHGLHDGDYVLTSVRHHAEVDPDTSPGARSGRFYRNAFTCIPAGLPFRPRRSTPKPVISGPQTAIVVAGPEDDEIFTDPYGRVKVKFHWDRKNGASPDSSCWIRVAQSSAGGGFGMVFVPRAGQEVVVQFQDGDPDQPLITGAVYNPKQMPPFTLPAGKMISGFRSNTYPRGGGNNEISVDDTGTNERMLIKSQYNQVTLVGNDRAATVKMNSVEDVGQNVSETVGNDKSVKVNKNSTMTVGINRTESIGVNRSISVGASETATVAIASMQTTGVMRAVSTGVLNTTTTGVVDLETAGVAKVLSAGLAYALNVGVVMNTIVGASMITKVGVSSAEDVGVTKTVSVGSKFEIKCGASRLTMDAGGKVTIEGTEFLFKASGNVQVKGAVIDLN